MRARLNEVFPDTQLIGESPAILKVKELIGLVAPREATVLITGPSGTGKELVARAIHANSPRADRKLVAINCAAFPETLLESELFGHEKGAFTGADAAKQGRFELAEGGTLFLDEIGEMPASMQVKLLRVLEERKIQRLGSVKEIELDIRIIAATNRNLTDMVVEKRFREDLYYRLNVINIAMPSLRERPADILLLTNFFIDRFARKTGKVVRGISAEAAGILSSYEWPGNVRELENILERAVVLARGDQITSADLAGLDHRSNSTEGSDSLLPLAEIERRHIRNCLDSLDWNLGACADRLGIHRNTLRSKIKEYRLNRE
jgi:two-component system response regulator HydG